MKKALPLLAIASVLAACTLFSPLDYLTEGPADAGAEGAAPGEAGVVPRALAVDQAVPELLVIDARALYWHNAGSGTIATVAKEGGTPRIVAQAAPLVVGLAVDAEAGGFVYWATESEVRRAPKDGGDGGSERVHTGTLAIVGFAMDETSLFVIEATNDGSPGTVARIPKAGGARVVLDDKDDPASVAVDATTLFWVAGDESAVRFMPKDTTPAGDAAAPRTTFGDVDKSPVFPDPPTAFVVDSDAVYWADTTEGKVQRHAREAGGASQLLFAEETATFGGIAVDDTFVWFTVQSAGTVGRAPKRSGAPEIVVRGVTSPSGIATDGANVYFTQRGNGGTTGAVMTIPAR